MWDPNLVISQIVGVFEDCLQIMTQTNNVTNVSSAASNVASGSKQILKRNSKDVGWDYVVIVDPGKLDKVKYKLYSKQLSGEVYRAKCHSPCQRNGNPMSKVYR